MEIVSTDIKTMVYIESEAEFNRAKMKGVWEVIRNRIIGRNPCLFALDDAVATIQPVQSIDLGLRDISLKTVIGSVGRNRDFTQHLLPCTENREGKERWRKIYTLAITGAGFPPVELYKVGPDYFVEDGHHRISVAKYLNWKTIQAYVTELLPA